MLQRKNPLKLNENDEVIDGLRKYIFYNVPQKQEDRLPNITEPTGDIFTCICINRKYETTSSKKQDNPQQNIFYLSCQ